MLIRPTDIPEKKVYRGAPVTRNLALVAQIYSISDIHTGAIKFDDDFIRNVRELKYPQVMFLPKKAGVLNVDSLLRLDECQSVFNTQLTALPYELGGEVRDLLRSQFVYFFSEMDDEVFTEFRKLCAGA